MSIPLQVAYENRSSSKTSTVSLNASRLQTVDELCIEAFKEVEKNVSLTLDNFGLYHRKEMVWLNPSKYVWEVPQIVPGCVLELKLKKRCIKIRFLDGRSKTIFVDETQPVKEVTKEICRSLHLDEDSYGALSLVATGDYAVDKSHPISLPVDTGSVSPSAIRHVKTNSYTGVKGSPLLKAKSPKDKIILTGSPSLSPRIRRKIEKSPGNQESGDRVRAQSLGSVNVEALSKAMPRTHSKKQIFKKHQIRLDTPWLDPEKTLREQEVNEEDEVILMYRYFYHMDLNQDSKNVELLFKQASVTYLTGELLCTEDEMSFLSALLCQILKKDYNPKVNTLDFYLSIRSLIAPPKCKMKSMHKDLAGHHASLCGMSPRDAKCCFVKMWSTLPLFGIEFLSCVNEDTKEKGLIAVSKHKVQFFPYRGKKSYSRDFEDVIRYRHEEHLEQVSITFRASDGVVGNTLRLHVPEYSGVLYDCIKGHFHLNSEVSEMVKNKRHFQFDIGFESQLPPFMRSTSKDGHIQVGALEELTYDQVYWANRLDNPLISEEELMEMREGMWENPLFQNMDQLMDERFNFLDSENLSSEDEDDVFQSGSKPKHVSFPPMGSPRVKPSGQKERSSSPVVARRMDSSPTSSSPMFPRQVFSNSNAKQSASPLVGRSISEGPMTGSGSPFTGSPIIFRKDFVKGSPFASPHLKHK